jgi:MarR family transcriptional regulator, organic hydroperoxide resistance regulator
VSDLRRLFSDLRLVSAQLSRAVDARLRHEIDLPLALFEQLAVIADQDDCRVYDLAIGLSASSGTVSKLVDRLEAYGYCRRLPNPGDRRSSLIGLTAAGTEKLHAAEHIVDAELQLRLGTYLSAAEIADLGALLSALRAALTR